MAFQFKITLNYTEHPTVWRRVLLDNEDTFWDLHLAIQNSFGWQNDHLFEFMAVKGKNKLPQNVGIPSDYGFGEPTLDAGEVKLNEFFSKGKKVNYIYDFGDSWTHLVVCELVNSLEVNKAQCLAGEGACPPEDCGGVWGYYHKVEAANDPKDPEHEEIRGWLGLKPGQKWDVNAFDLEEVNEAMF